MNEPKDYEYLLLCDGSTISDENYPELVAVLGGTQLPNLIDRVVQGAATAGTYKAAGLPNISGSTVVACRTDYIENGALKANRGRGTLYGLFSTSSSISTQNFVDAGLMFNASKSNSIYGASTTVQPPAFTTKIYICYAG